MYCQRARERFRLQRMAFLSGAEEDWHPRASRLVCEWHSVRLCGLLLASHQVCYFWCGGIVHVLAPVMRSCLFFFVSVRISRIGCARYCGWPRVFGERMGLCFCFPTYRFVLPCFVPFQMVTNIRFLGIVDVTNLVLRHAKRRFLSCNLCRGLCFFWMPKRMCAVSVFVVLRMPGGILVVVPRRQR